MSDSEKEIAKYAAQIYQARKVASLTVEEVELVLRLEKHGYLRRSTNGFVGSMTDKAMIREPAYRKLNIEGFGKTKT